MASLIEAGAYRLVIIENLGIVLGEASTTEARTRAAMYGLSQVAQATNTAVVAIVHLTKVHHAYPGLPLAVAAQPIITQLEQFPTASWDAVGTLDPDAASTKARTSSPTL